MAKLATSIHIAAKWIASAPPSQPPSVTHAGNVKPKSGVAGYRGGEERALPRVNVLPGEVQRRLGRRQGRVVLQRLLDQGVEGLGVEQRPPLSGNVETLHKTLRLAARH